MRGLTVLVSSDHKLNDDADDDVADDEPDCDVTMTSPIRCNVTLYASSIHKALESLEVRPVIRNSSNCVTSWSAKKSPSMPFQRRFVLFANVTNSTSDACTIFISAEATELTGKLVSTIDDRRPVYQYNHTISAHQGTVNV